MGFLRFKRKKRQQKIHIYSFGGVGTRTFYKYVSKFHLVNSQSNVHHGFTDRISENERVVYIYDNPISAIKSFYRKHKEDNKFIDLHSKNLGITGNFPETIEIYAQLKKDIFQLENHFDRYFTSNCGYPILFLRFSEIWDNVSDIENYLNIEMSGFPARKERTSAELDIETRQILEDTYSGLINKMNNIPPYLVNENCVS